MFTSSVSPNLLRLVHSRGVLGDCPLEITPLSLRENLMAIVITIAISNHDTKGTTRNIKAGFVLGGLTTPL